MGANDYAPGYVVGTHRVGPNYSSTILSRSTKIRNIMDFWKKVVPFFSKNENATFVKSSIFAANSEPLI